MRQKLSLCNEVLAGWDFERQCAYAAALGYQGLEVAPFTLAEDPLTITSTQAQSFRRIAADHGLVISGLHWLLVAPLGLSISSPDAQVSQRTNEAMRRLIDLCAELGGSYLVHGSPAQRNPGPGQSQMDAMARATDAWLKAGEQAGKLGLHYCVEPLSADQTSVLNTVAQGVALVQEAGLPGLKTMLDTCSALRTELMPLPELVDQWWSSGALAHVQLNDANRRGPGQGEYAFGPLLAALQRQGYSGWLAMEPFDYVPDGQACAALSMGYVKGLLEAAN